MRLTSRSAARLGSRRSSPGAELQRPLALYNESALDVCLVTFHSGTDSISGSLRPHDRLWVRDNTFNNIGFAAGANIAASFGEDELIAFMNPDGRPTQACLDALELAMHDPAIVAVQPEEGPGFQRAPITADGDMDWLSAACLVVRRAAFETVGGFDERLFMYCEDVDLSYKLKHLGRLVLVPTVSFHHSTAPRPYVSLHRFFRNWLVVHARHQHADVNRMLRDAAYSVRSGDIRTAIARATAIADFELRSKRWS